MPDSGSKPLIRAVVQLQRHPHCLTGLLMVTFLFSFAHLSLWCLYVRVCVPVSPFLFLCLARILHWPTGLLMARFLSTFVSLWISLSVCLSSTSTSYIQTPIPSPSTHTCTNCHFQRRYKQQRHLEPPEITTTIRIPTTKTTTTNTNSSSSSSSRNLQRTQQRYRNLHLSPLGVERRFC